MGLVISVVFAFAFSLAYATAQAVAWADSSSVIDELTKNVGNPNFVPAVQAIAERLQNEQGTATKLHLIIASAAVLFLKHAIDGLLKLTSPRDNVKKALPIILALLGAIVGVLDVWIGGASWQNALLVGGAPFVSVAYNEAWNVARDWLQKPAVAPPATVAPPTETPPTG